MANMRQLAVACRQYAEAHNSSLPQTLEELKPYLATTGKEDHNPFVCPAATDRSAPSYEIVGAGEKLSAEHANETIMLRETKQFHPRGRNVAYQDGHVEFHRESSDTDIPPRP